MTTYASVWDAIADTPEQAANLAARASLMRDLQALVLAAGWTQADARAALRRHATADE